MLLLFRPGRQWSRWHFSSLNCMKKLPIHGWDMTLERRLPCIASHRHLKERRPCPWIHPNLLDTAGHRLPEEWETSRLWPRQITALNSTCILFLTGIYIPQDVPLLCKVMLCYLSWARVSLYVTMAVTASDRDPEILVQSQHSLTSASCSSTRLFCASLRVSNHLYQQLHERQK